MTTDALYESREEHIRKVEAFIAEVKALGLIEEYDLLPRLHERSSPELTAVCRKHGHGHLVRCDYLSGRTDV